MAPAFNLFPWQFDEAEVRRLAGAVAFARADAWQRAGHLRQPVVRSGVLSGTVRGTWQRADDVQVTAPAGRLQSSCTCEQPTLCVHAATLLLHWLRQPATFVPARPSPHAAPSPAAAYAPIATGGIQRGRRSALLADFDDDDFDDFVGDDDDEDALDLELPEEVAAAIDPGRTATDELAALFDLASMAELREIARRREFRPTARSKADLARQLAEALARPESVDAALSRLNPDELLALHVIDLLGSSLATQEHITQAFRTLGGRAAQPPLSVLVELALVGAVQFAGTTAIGYAVPTAVTPRLGPLPALARPLQDGAKLPAATPATLAPGLDLRQGLLALVHEAETRVIPPHPQQPRPALNQQYAPSYWVILSQEQTGRPNSYAVAYGVARLAPIPPMLGQEELERLARAMGRPVGFVTFVLHVALTFDILDTTDRLTAKPEFVQALLMVPPALQRQMLLATLAAPHYLAELRRLLAEDGPLEFHARLGYFGQTTPLLGQAAELRQLLVRAIAKLPPDVWYDYPAFLELLRRWAPWQSPHLSFVQRSSAKDPIWWVSDHAKPKQALDLDEPEAWQSVYGRYIGDTLSGPLAWIGMLDLAPDSDGPRAFRVRPPGGEQTGAGQTLAVDADFTVHVPAGAPDGGIYSLLAQAAELVGFSPDGLRYRLSGERVRALFDDGMSGLDLLRYLERRSAAPLPERVRQAVQRWWTGYGRVRLYDDLTLLELADDYLLPELLRTTKLADVLIHTFSPRLIAVEPEGVDRLIADLTRAGHPPGLFEGR